MKLALIVLGSFALIILLVLAVGWLLPVKHVAARTVKLRAPSAKVWQAISDFTASAAWRSDLQNVQQVEISPGVFGWKETARNGDALTYSTLEADPERRLVRKIADQNLPFGGSWTFALEPAGAGTNLTITENGEVYNPFFRFMARFVFGHHATIDRYLADLKKHLEG